MRSLITSSCAAAVAIAIAGTVHAQDNIRGDTTGPTTAPGFSHAEQYMHVTDVKPAPNMYPVVHHPELDKNAADKLAALDRLVERQPRAVPYIVRVGCPTAVTIGGAGLKRTS